MKRIIAVVASIILITFLTGCDGKITTGEITKKEFTPAHTQVMIIPMHRSNGKTTSTMMMPYIYHYNAKYEIEIQQYKDGQIHTASYRVTEDVYKSLSVGDEFIYQENYEPTEPEYTRERQ